MERKALGKGLGALIPEIAVDSTNRRKEEIIYVQSGQIKPNPFQPREDFDEQSIGELAQSIKEKGVIQPLLVRRQGDNYELIAGERRLRAANILGLKEIPVIVRDVSDQDSLELALIENVQREGLNPIEEAHAYQHLVDKFQVTQEKISEVLGKSRVSITNTLRLLKLPHEIQGEMKKGRISFAHGRALLEIEDANHQRRLAQDVISKGLSVRELENLIKSVRPKSIKRNISQGQREPLVAILEEQLQHALATKVRISKRKKRGHINIEFYSPEDLQRIVNVIKGTPRA
ncbi:MAG: ParB/RepB/Spo0J family partition protein [Candidatus Omnitrophica bacterium]|nr:ParB/RepB/Spo0J family partition protein [Candidatus Omnitrophota bacterium]MBU4303024.1 ParB/RepB/Spo0J family partition protein [Candidatus Omnitrophota bacterium]MBU4418425.1 ParB/RepB/Spo0J family partition protein [Candidatus Omnitrophota bacterium]MBU4467271.1 ParB/RepB/Spo0J family partition protein [Candidatus Omnitrophota bacterium]MCG2707391.1 ParB/RepB/Spo0J family partition protein [Candidatus Omnitrophota bacterium]